MESSRSSRVDTRADLVVSHQRRKDQETIRKVELIKDQTSVGSSSLQKGVRMEINVGFNMFRRMLAKTIERTTNMTRERIRKRKKYVRIVDLVKSVIKKTVN